ncbi:Hypothetical_protein [Hexamita inflata]|uniref:Hypothetical_protein n=1 Tax=Hexamita inflata TaxID=28002 RepID=A0AA86TGB9_9EUKA|nr:Hypothetical protein HINF_LOCUS3017 [Hexamita inflata]
MGQTKKNNNTLSLKHTCYSINHNVQENRRNSEQCEFSKSSCESEPSCGFELEQKIEPIEVFVLQVSFFNTQLHVHIDKKIQSLKEKIAKLQRELQSQFDTAVMRKFKETQKKHDDKKITQKTIYRSQEKQLQKIMIITYNYQTSITTLLKPVHMTPLFLITGLYLSIIRRSSSCFLILLSNSECVLVIQLDGSSTAKMNFTLYFTEIIQEKLIERQHEKYLWSSHWSNIYSKSVCCFTHNIFYSC